MIRDQIKVDNSELEKVGISASSLKILPKDKYLQNAQLQTIPNSEESETWDSPLEINILQEFYTSLKERKRDEIKTLFHENIFNGESK